MDGDLSLLPNDFEDCFVSDIDILRRTPFRLLDLPPELWVRICEFAVLKSCPIVIGHQTDMKDMARVALQPSITRTCRVLRHEALPLFYTLNSWEMIHNYSVPCPRRFLHAIGATNLHKMTLLMHSNCDIEFWKDTCKRWLVECEVEQTCKIGHSKHVAGRGWYWTFRITFT